MGTGFGPGGGFDFMFTLVPILVAIGFIFVFGMLIFRGISGASEWHNNNQQPVLRRKVKVVAKRDEVSTYRHGRMNDMHRHRHSSTTYYATFEKLENGRRTEFQVKDREYGLLAEGDEGVLIHQGTRYKGFERNVG